MVAQAQRGGVVYGRERRLQMILLGPKNVVFESKCVVRGPKSVVFGPKRFVLSPKC